MWTYSTPPDNELRHYGVLGMKWGVRRNGNTNSNIDSDKLGIAAAKKYESILAVKKASTNKNKRLAVDRLKENFKLVSYGEDYLKQQGYKTINYDFLTEKDTGEQYVKSTLVDSGGRTFSSEFYLGAVIKD